MKILIIGEGDDPNEMMDIILKALEDEQPHLPVVELKALESYGTHELELRFDEEIDFKSQPYKHRLWKKR